MLEIDSVHRSGDSIAGSDALDSTDVPFLLPITASSESKSAPAARVMHGAKKQQTHKDHVYIMFHTTALCMHS